MIMSVPYGGVIVQDGCDRFTVSSGVKVRGASAVICKAGIGNLRIQVPHGPIMNQVIHPQPAGEIRHHQPKPDLFAVAQAAAAIRQLQIQARSAGAGKRGDKGMQGVQGRTEHLIHTVHAPIDLTRRHDRGDTLAQRINRLVAGET